MDDDPRTAALRAAVAAHHARDAAERRSTEIVLHALAALPRPFDEHADPTHVTGSAIVTDGDGHVVLHRHKRLGTWLQPGGHVDRDESVAEAARRETREETGLAARHPAGGPVLLHLDVHPGPRGHRHLDVRYLLLAAGDAPLRPAAGESPDAAWFALEEAIRRSDASLASALRALEARTTPAVRTTAGGGPPRPAAGRGRSRPSRCHGTRPTPAPGA